MSLILLFAGVGGDNIAPNDSTHGHTVDAAAVTITAQITGLNALHGHTADAATVATSLVVPADSTHGHTVDVATVSNVVRPADATHSQTADAAGITITNSIVPAETRHLTYADMGSVYGAPPAELIVELVATTVKLELIGV